MYYKNFLLKYIKILFLYILNMVFKKKVLKQTNTLLNIVWVFIIILIFSLGYIAVNSVNLGFKSNINWSLTWTWKITIENPTKQKKEINILLVWRWWIWNDAPLLTDTIILAKLNPTKKTISLLSIQRDLYVNYPDKDWTGKINSVYAHYFAQNLHQSNNRVKADRIWISKLASKIQDITWETIDFYINVDFDWFKKIIDTIGWIEVDIKHSFVDRTFPDWNWWYTTVSFKEWLQTMNWDMALKFSRSRHSTSDFDRSLRQQQVIEAIKNKLLSINISQIKELYDVFIQNLTTDISLENVIDLALNYWVLKDKYNFISSNFNDSCLTPNSECQKWGILYVPNRAPFWGQWVSLINWSTASRLSNYELSRKYSDIVLNYPLISNENYEINIFNASWWAWVAWSFINEFKRYWFNVSRSNIYTAPEKYENSIIYYNGIEDSDTLNALKKFFSGKFEKTLEPKYPMAWKNTEPTRRAKIEIIIWKDYQKLFNF